MIADLTGNVETSFRFERGSSAFEEMTQRLRLWARWCRGRTTDAEMWDSDPVSLGGLTRDQIDEAWTVQKLIEALPIRERITLGVHFVLFDAYDSAPYVEINRRLRAANEPTIGRDDPQRIRHHAIGQLIEWWPRRYVITNGSKLR